MMKKPSGALLSFMVGIGDVSALRFPRCVASARDISCFVTYRIDLSAVEIQECQIFWAPIIVSRDLVNTDSGFWRAILLTSH